MSLLDDAVAAFEGGDAQRCVTLLTPRIGQERDSRYALLLGEACRKTGDRATLDKAADWLLGLDPASIRAMVWKGDVCWDAAERRLAARYYGTALDRADGKALPPALAAEMARVDDRMTSLQDRLLAFLDDYLTRHGLPPESRSARVAQSIRILAGQAEADRSFQKPTSHHLPGLPHIGWYDAADFPFVAEMEAQAAAMRGELLDVLAENKGFTPYIETNGTGPARDYQGLENNPDWGAYYFWKDGAPVADNLARCPVIAAALAKVPQPRLAGRMPTAMFSKLTPGTHIPPHHGMLNCRLIAHLPLIVPPSCAMRVDQEIRPWQEGKICIFDDSVEHEAWNHSDATRVVLLFDVARPEIAADEYQAIRLCFEAVDAYH